MGVPTVVECCTVWFFADFCHEPCLKLLWHRHAYTRKSSIRHSSTLTTHVSHRVWGPFRGPSLARGSAPARPPAICRRSAAPTSSSVIGKDIEWIVRQGCIKASELGWECYSARSLLPVPRQVGAGCVPCQLYSPRCFCLTRHHHTVVLTEQTLCNLVFPGVSSSGHYGAYCAGKFSSSYGGLACCGVALL